MWVTKLLISPGKNRIFCPKLAFWFILGRLIWCPVGGLVGGCGALAVSRKTTIYFICYQMDLTFPGQFSWSSVHQEILSAGLLRAPLVCFVLILWHVLRFGLFDHFFSYPFLSFHLWFPAKRQSFLPLKLNLFLFTLSPVFLLIFLL